MLKKNYQWSTVNQHRTFRNYVLNYLKNNPKVDQDEIVLVRQLEISPQGMPLEIYCFANKAELVDYERIQADILTIFYRSTRI